MFKAKGAEPQWKPIYTALAQAKVDQLLTYEMLTEIAGYDVQKDRAALYEAIKRLELHDRRTAECVRGEGYRIIRAREHHAVGLKHQLKAKRSVRRGRRKVAAADRSQLTTEERQRMDVLETRLGKHETMLINHEGRLKALEKASTQTSTQMGQIQRKQAELEQMLRVAGYIKNSGR